MVVILSRLEVQTATVQIAFPVLLLRMEYPLYMWYTTTELIRYRYDFCTPIIMVTYKNNKLPFELDLVYLLIVAAVVVVTMVEAVVNLKHQAAQKPVPDLHQE